MRANSKVEIKRALFKDLHPRTLERLSILNNEYGGDDEDFASFMSGFFYDGENSYLCDKLETFVARQHKRIVGWCTVHHEQWVTFRCRGIPRIIRSYSINVYVDPRYRGRGIGTQLVQTARNELKHRKRKFVGNPINEVGEKLFSNTGVKF